MVNVNHRIDPAVYALHAGDFVFAYVGETSKNSQNRLYEHIYRARSGHSGPVYQWMRGVGLENVQVVDLVKEPDAATRAAIEAATIARLIDEGHPLRNQVARDGVPGSMSADSRDLIGAKARGRVTWIAGKRGEAAGWTQERRDAMKQRMTA